VLKILAADHRPFGKTGLTVPPIALGTSALGNVRSILPPAKKVALCGEWLNHVEPPIWLETGPCCGGAQGLETLFQMAQRLDVSPDDVLIGHLLNWQDAAQAWRGDCRLLGDVYRPKLVAINEADKYLDEAASPQERDRRIADVTRAFQELLKLKEAGEVVAVGVAGKDWRCIEMIGKHVPFDWVRLSGCFSPMHGAPDVVRFMASLAERQIPIVLAGVFHSGFLVGGQCYDHRVLDTEDEQDARQLAWRKSFVALCHGHGISPAHACIQFALSAPGVVAVAVDTTQPERVAENVRSVLTRVPGSLWESMKEEGLLAM